MLSPIVKISIWIIIGGAILSVIVILFGDLAFPEQIGVAFDYFFTILWQFDFILPVKALLTALYLILTLDITFFLVKLTMKIINKLTGHNE